VSDLGALLAVEPPWKDGEIYQTPQALRPLTVQSRVTCLLCSTSCSASSYNQRHHILY
jgi:hypothetical protein